MAENIFVCKHLKGAGYCTLYEAYCHEGPCGDSTPVEYSPVVHGRWIHDINNLYGCSECMERETMSPKKLKPYCPHCGAKMDGEADV